MFTSLFSKTNRTHHHQFQHKCLTKDVLCKVWFIINISISRVNIITFTFINSFLLITYLGDAAFFYCWISFLLICNFIIDIYSMVHLIIARAIISMWLLHILPTRGHSSTADSKHIFLLFLLLSSHRNLNCQKRRSPSVSLSCFLPLMSYSDLEQQNFTVYRKAWYVTNTFCLHMCLN